VSSEIFEIAQHKRLNWTTTIAMALFHLGAIAALFVFSWRNFWISVFLYWVATGLGISLGYHRLHTHRSYKAPRLLEYFFAICGCLTLEGGPITWVATHRIHHQKSDHEGDPHSPRDGMWWSHVGWILFGESLDRLTGIVCKYAPDLGKDRFYVWINRYFWIPLVVLGAALLAIGGWSLFLWGICLRVVFGLHTTWLVNSATHMWGRRRFATRDDSRNNWWVALLTFGEGWHNNHHAHPTSARHGLAWYEFDPSWITLKILRKFGIAKAVQCARLDAAAGERKAA
jgi:stearoyl-CoA desaturase (delta-9 desaturase)